MPWRLTKRETAMPVEDSGTWSITVEIRDREGGWPKEEGWSMGKESREIMNTRTI